MNSLWSTHFRVRVPASGAAARTTDHYRGRTFRGARARRPGRSDRDFRAGELVEVSMLLGHSELRVTADLYSHLQQQTAAKAARQMDAILG